MQASTSRCVQGPRPSTARACRLASTSRAGPVRVQCTIQEARPSGSGSGTNGVPLGVTPKGAVPNRPILEVPDWENQVRRTSRLQHPNTPASLSRLRLFSGTANPTLAGEVAHYLGMELSKIKCKRFADGEIYVQVQESIRGCDVFLIQPTCPPVNDHLMELLITIDACRRASARSITAVIPYYGYARADRKVQGRESIAAKLTANLITEAGADRVLAIDLHSGQCVGYFDIPVDHVYGETVILDYLASKRIATGDLMVASPSYPHAPTRPKHTRFPPPFPPVTPADYLASKRIATGDLVVVSPDVGGVARARAFAKKLNDAPLAIVDKRRSAHNVSEVMNLIGDVRGKVAVLVDDMIDTAGTITNAAKVLAKEGAREVYACATHAVFSPPAVERLSSGVFQEVIVTNTIPVAPANIFPQLTILSVANLLGETIWRVYNAASVQALRD
ncbi:hypothetical protein HYH03_011622 [Edaphochlamys debaryana]|uniref:ribose-phosphate diphosphokinase n=1 Tax=Edaphochlamys debaryana TaxID=47281 RepID=A0A835Y2Q4_9CHLO|nr:hypothetical protein HYH03_011622 [Edaphochlamys debaryana]|eukprot:KAG2489994.1 hypothetical protein HYH03_011622 [Edaphochlamys debaryana]